MRRRFLLTLAGCLAAAGLAGAAAEGGEALLCGFVLDEKGEPVAGAKVTLNRYTDGELDPVFPEPAITDEAGVYELKLGVADGDVVVLRDVWAQKPGYVRASVDPELRVNAGATVTVDFRLDPGFVLAGRVDLGDDGPRTRTPRVLFAFNEREDRFLVLADDSGNFETYLPEGVYSIRARGAVVRGKLVELRADGLQTGQRDIVVGPAPAPPALTASPEAFGAAFDALCDAMDSRYSYFIVKPDLDWPAWRAKHRPSLVAAESVDAFVERLREALAELRDPHIVIETPQGDIGTFGVPFRPNWNPRVDAQTYVDPVVCGGFALVGRTAPDGFGYVVITRQGAATLDNVQQTVEAIRQHADAPGFLVDLRAGASGGSEPLAMKVASAFCDEPTVYAKHKYRSGRGHDEFAQDSERRLPAGERPYTGPVVCLIGHRCMSSGEALVLMMDALPNVTTVGAATRGSSGNPKPFALPGLDVAVRFSTWVAMKPDGTPFEGVGIEPDFKVDAPAKAHQDADPTLERGLELLRAKVAERQAP